MEGESVPFPLPFIEMATPNNRISRGINNQAHMDSGKPNSKGYYREKAEYQKANVTRCIIENCKTDTTTALKSTLRGLNSTPMAVTKSWCLLTGSRYLSGTVLDPSSVLTQPILGVRKQTQRAHSKAGFEPG